MGRIAMKKKIRDKNQKQEIYEDEKHIERTQAKSQFKQNILTQPFENKMKAFQLLTKQIINQRCGSLLDAQNEQKEIQKKIQRIYMKYEETINQIFREEVIQLQNWMENNKISTKDYLEKLQRVIQNNIISLRQAGQFTEEQITDQIKPLEKYKVQRKNNIIEYQKLLGKMKDMYH